jgi:hypothetical protein
VRNALPSPEDISHCNREGRYLKTEGRSPGERPSALQSFSAYLFFLAAFFAPFLAAFLAAFFFVAIVKNFVVSNVISICNLPKFFTITIIHIKV